MTTVMESSISITKATSLSIPQFGAISLSSDMAPYPGQLYTSLQNYVWDE